MGLQKGLLQSWSTGLDEFKFLLKLYIPRFLQRKPQKNIGFHWNVIGKSVKPQRVLKKEILIAVCIRLFLTKICIFNIYMWLKFLRHVLNALCVE